ncbi:hypothetical protein C8R47DRAFT_1146493 [Mycena vitilis]|nr:hypothetical protein C8R47DRAFT_1146493 [Mycena vitilis]
MSSNDETSNGEGSEPVRNPNTRAPPHAKQRRVQHACNMCRRKKRRCDGGDPCDHCAKHDFICTYIAPSEQTELEPSSSHSADVPSRGYVEALEARVKAAEALVAARSQARTDTRSPGVQLVSNAIRRLNSPDPAPHSDDLPFADIGASFRALAIDVDGGGRRRGRGRGRQR